MQVARQPGKLAQLLQPPGHADREPLGATRLGTRRYFFP